MTMISDNPIFNPKDDYLSMEKQIKGFSKYIRNCDTPITISIQGKWGSGKTSFFQLLRSHIQQEEIENSNLPECKFITFNAWQYSQFNNDSNLPTSLLAYLVKKIKQISPKDDETEKITGTTLSAIKIIGSFVAYAGNEFLKNKTGIDAIDAVNEVKSINDDLSDFIKLDAVDTLQNDFNKCVEHCLKDKGPDARLIIFIDDLDRLLPEKAIELLEIMKIFLDSPRCVFLLAIDYDVVVNGVMAKYKNTISAEKGKDYFEKMIQVVYKLPGTMSNMTGYLRNLLSKDEYGINQTCANEITDLLIAAHKDNPRGVKRFINNFLLIRSIGIESGAYPKPNRDVDICLFAFVCLQETCPKLNNKFCNNISSPANIISLMNDINKWYNNKGGSSSDNNEIHYFLEDKNEEFIRKFAHILYNCTPIDEDEEYTNFDYYTPNNIDNIYTALRIINYSLSNNYFFSKVEVSPNSQAAEYLITNKKCEEKDLFKAEYTNNGSIQDTFITSLKLILDFYDDEVKRVIRQKLPYFKESNTGECDEIKSGASVFYVKKYNDSEYIKALHEIIKELPFKVDWYLRVDDKMPCYSFEDPDNNKYDYDMIFEG